MNFDKAYSWFPLALLWFGAAMSVAEIQTGGLMSAAGPVTGLTALLAGHVAGSCLLGLMGYLGFKERMPSLMCTRIAFGRRGSWLLSLANVMQLLGWTAVMLQLNSQALGGITRTLWGFESPRGAVLFLACLVAIWALRESRGKYSANTIAVILLALLGLLTTWVLCGHTADPDIAAPPPQAPLAFSEAFELSLIMPRAGFPWWPITPAGPKAPAAPALPRP